MALEDHDENKVTSHMSIVLGVGLAIIGFIIMCLM
jgi:hypothetical protein